MEDRKQDKTLQFQYICLYFCEHAHFKVVSEEMCPIFKEKTTTWEHTLQVIHCNQCDVRTHLRDGPSSVIWRTRPGKNSGKCTAVRAGESSELKL